MGACKCSCVGPSLFAAAVRLWCMKSSPALQLHITGMVKKEGLSQSRHPDQHLISVYWKCQDSFFLLLTFNGNSLTEQNRPRCNSLLAPRSRNGYSDPGAEGSTTSAGAQEHSSMSFTLAYITWLHELVIDLKEEGQFNHSGCMLYHLSRCTFILVLLRCLQTVNHDALRLMVNLRLALCLLWKAIISFSCWKSCVWEPTCSAYCLKLKQNLMKSNFHSNLKRRLDGLNPPGFPVTVYSVLHSSRITKYTPGMILLGFGGSFPSDMLSVCHPAPNQCHICCHWCRPFFLYFHIICTSITKCCT